MGATPAQVANYMAAQAKYWRGRDGAIEMACLTAARIIRSYLGEEHPDGRAVHGAVQQLSTQMGRLDRAMTVTMRNSLHRAEQTICDLRTAGRASQ